MSSLPRSLLILIGFFFFIALAWYFSNILTYLLIAGLLSLVGQPLMEFIATRKIRRFTVPRTLAAFMTMGVMLLIALMFISIFIPLVVKEANMISRIDTAQLAAAFEKPFRSVESFLRDAGVLKNESLSHYLQHRLKSVISFTNVSNLLGTIVGFTGNLFVSFVSVMFILFFFLKEKDLFYRIIKAFTPAEYEQNTDKAFHGAKHLLTRYLLGILGQIIILAVILFIGLSIIGVRSALLIAFFGAILNIIPYVGVIIAFVIGTLIAIAEVFPIEFYPGMFWLAVKMGIVFWLAQLIDNFITQPLIFSSSLRTHPLEIFLVILAGGTAGGVFGMILAVPAYTVLRVIAKEFFSEFKIVRELTG
ncbi:MAG TPA: AI-2E family transporter [Chitinophagales bacterium]|nr:AI-2E family transporter [Chitinophagales bacterium]